MKSTRNSKKGIRVISPWQVGDTDNFHAFDLNKDFDIEPIPADRQDADNKEVETELPLSP